MKIIYSQTDHQPAQKDTQENMADEVSFNNLPILSKLFYSWVSRRIVVLSLKFLNSLYNWQYFIS